MSKPLQNDVLISSKLFEELIWLQNLVKNGFWYFPDFVKKLVPVTLKLNDIQRAHSMANSVLSVKSEALSTQVACHILLQSNYKGIDKARLLTANAQNRCKAILYSLSSIKKTEDNRANILWPRLELLKKKLAVFDFEKLPGLGIIQFKNREYLMACCQPVMPILEKLTIYDFLTPLSDELLNNTRRCMLFTMNSIMLTKAFEKQIEGVPYMDFMGKEFEERKANKIADTNIEPVPTPEGIEYHILNLNAEIKTLKRQNKDLIAASKQKMTDVPVTMTADDVAAQIKIFIDEANQLKAENSELKSTITRINDPTNTIVSLSLRLNELTETTNKLKLELIKEFNTKDTLTKLIDEKTNLLILAENEKTEARKSAKHNSELATTMQNQVNLGLTKYRELQQRYETLVEQLNIKDKKILHLTETSGNFVNAAYVEHLSTELNHLKSSIKVGIISQTTQKEVDDAKLGFLTAFKPFAAEKLRGERLIAIEAQKKKEYVILESEILTDKITEEEIDTYSAVFLQKLEIYNLIEKCGNIIGSQKTLAAYEQLNKDLLIEKTKNSLMETALIQVKNELVKETFSDILGDYSKKHLARVQEDMERMQLITSNMKEDIEKKIQNINQVMSNKLKDVKNQLRGNFVAGIKQVKEETIGVRYSNNSTSQKGKQLQIGQKIFFSHRNAILEVSSIFNPSIILDYNNDNLTLDEMEAQKFYNSMLRCGHKPQFTLR